ncbi:hypothetical protein Sjap_019806 [Stephania japonica]|uniref:PWWP domain-containing protein n=1 Tax=Stephania japonica TaxID=461633 RepID=A0AAP0HYG4_9MAGN
MGGEGELGRESPGGSDDPPPSMVVEGDGGGEVSEGMGGGVVDKDRHLVGETRVSEELLEADDGVVCVESERVGKKGNEHNLLEEVRVLEELEWEPGNDDECVDVGLESEREREENVGISSEDVRLLEELWVKSGKNESDVVSVEFEGGRQEDGEDLSENVDALEVKVEGSFRGDIADFGNSLAEGVGVEEIKTKGAVERDGLAASESELGQTKRMSAQEEVKASEVEDEGAVRSDGFAGYETVLVQMTGMPDREARVSSDKMMVESSYSDFGIAYSSAEDGTNSRISEAAFGSQAAMVLSYGFEAGDLVWGKVKSHPWWPGHIFCEAFASPSVRRSKRDGHVLVAFFGDSSYGWFDLAELIPFESNFAEKSRQTNSRNLVRAVEEAVDESCRRQALGLTCCCRSQFNFRPTSVQGYFSVDVPGYEQGTVYSVQQIKKARDKFQPTKVLSFVQQLATMPRNGDQKALEWINYRATVLAFRKASFEEFDETYAQAFGVQSAHPSPESVNGSDQGARVPSRAPLSGPLVVAEAFGERKGSGRLPKMKEHSRKDKYLFKRRDEPAEPRDFHNVPAQTNLAVSSAYSEGSTVTISSDYVFQKRTPDVSAKPNNESNQEGSGNDGTGGAALAGDTRWQEIDYVGSSLAATEFSLADITLIDPPTEVGVNYPANEPVANAITSSSLEDGRLYANTGSSMYEMDGISKPDLTARVLATGQDKSMMSRPHGLMNYSDHNFEAHDQYEQALSLPSENQSELYQVSDGVHFRTAVETVGASHVSNKPHGAPGVNTDTVVKKKKF